MTLREDYFDWLYKSIEQDQKSYKKLCALMHLKPFRAFVPNDDNRAGDGVYQRELFSIEANLDDDHLEVQYFYKGECTIFEMMVGLARRLEAYTYDPKYRSDQTPKWFGELLENLELDKFTDNRSKHDTLDPVDEAKIDKILDVLVERTYDFKGNGSLFPLVHRPAKDRKRVEIWYQMMDYLAENRKN